MPEQIEKLIPRDFNGVVSVSRNGESLFKKAYGHADLPNARANVINTRFGTASAGKAFVATGIMKLIETDKLSLDSKIDLLEIDLKEISAEITVRQLLNHTSGIPDYFDEEIMDEYADLWMNFPNYRVRESADILPLFIDKPMDFPPGTRFKYNNTGYVVLGLIIEKVTGMAFDKFLAEAVFAPCGMADTGYYELDRLPANCANAYIHDEERDEFYTNIYSIDAKGTGAGGAFTTAEDVERFWAGLLGGKIVNQETAAQMIASQLEGIRRDEDDDDDEGYGFGFWLGGETPYFQGCDPGVSFISSFSSRDNGLFVCIISNFGDNVWKLHRAIREKVRA